MTSKGHALSRDALIRTLTAYSGITTEDGEANGTTLVDSNLIGRNDFISEKTILIMSGDAKDEDKGATSFDNSDGKITLQGTGFNHQIKAGTIFRVLNISSIEIDVARIEAKLDNATYGLDALKILLDAIEVKLDRLRGESPASGSVTANWKSGISPFVMWSMLGHTAYLISSGSPGRRPWSSAFAHIRGKRATAFRLSRPYLRSVE